jgi:hypothetical protein
MTFGRSELQVLAYKCFHLHICRIGSGARF